MFPQIQIALSRKTTPSTQRISGFSSSVSWTPWRCAMSSGTPVPWDSSNPSRGTRSGLAESRKGGWHQGVMMLKCAWETLWLWIAMENGHRNSWFTMIYPWKLIFHSYVELPEGTCWHTWRWYVNSCTHKCVITCVSTHVYVYIYIYIHVCVCVRVCVCVCKRLNSWRGRWRGRERERYIYINRYKI